ncbi:MAG: sulfatase-like hydrolase/transferase [Phycisphaerales bacterium]|nr:sulfatase-like hydrolase/transferase [Phycisphaerales bacterium]
MPTQIVLLMTDTTRRDMLNCYADTGLQSPHLDRLAAQGMRFDRAYTCQPVCGPARAALFTGQWPHTNGSWANNIPLAAITRHLGQRIKDANPNKNIHTAYIGKWHLDASDYFGTGKCPDGWDPQYWYDMRNYLEELSPEDRTRSRKMSTNRDPITADFTFSHRCSNRAIDFLQKHKNEDFLLIVSYDEPHGPCLCPPPYCDMYQNYAFPKSPNVWDTLADKPEHQRAWAGEKLNHDKAARDALQITGRDFFGCQSFVDSEIGRVIDAIDRNTPDAMVIYTSDHGAALESHRLTDKGPAMYDEITRIPLIVRWPGKTPANTLCPHAVSHIDVTPTILDAFGILTEQTQKVLEGKSMLPTFRYPAIKPNDVIFMEFGRYEIDHDSRAGLVPIRCAFDGRHKLSINLLSTDELYDLDSDPYEMTNLIASPAHAAARNRLHDAILHWLNATRDPFRGPAWERRPWRNDARPYTYSYTGYRRQRHPDIGEQLQLDYATGLPLTEMDVHTS